jgi:hypothetical protein
MKSEIASLIESSLKEICRMRAEDYIASLKELGKTMLAKKIAAALYKARTCCPAAVPHLNAALNKMTASP